MSLNLIWRIRNSQRSCRDVGFSGKRITGGLDDRAVLRVRQESKDRNVGIVATRNGSGSCFLTRCVPMLRIAFVRDSLSLNNRDNSVACIGQAVSIHKIGVRRTVRIHSQACGLECDGVINSPWLVCCSRRFSAVLSRRSEGTSDADQSRECTKNRDEKRRLSVHRDGDSSDRGILPSHRSQGTCLVSNGALAEIVGDGRWFYGLCDPARLRIEWRIARNLHMDPQAIITAYNIRRTYW